MRGYWNKPEVNATAFTADGYFRTGDVGVFDQRGYLKIVDRKRDMILVSGFNVYPNENRGGCDRLSRCNGMRVCWCIGREDWRGGELFFVKTPDASLRAEDLVAHCRKEMTAYKAKIVQFIDSPPKSNVRKILGRELRDQ